MNVKNYSDDFNILKEHCGRNPLLLSEWINYNNEHMFEKIIIQEAVDQCLKYNLKFSEDDFAALYAEKFFKC